MYATDCNKKRIMRYPTSSATGSNGFVVAGGSGPENTVTTLNCPWGIHSLPSVTNDLYITNSYGHSVIKWTSGSSSGTFVAGTPGTPGSSAKLLSGPMVIKLDTD